MASKAKEQAELNGHINLEKENISHVRTKVATIAQDGLVKRRHLSVVDNNEQVRKVSVDGEDKGKNSVKSEANELVRKVQQNDQPQKDEQSIQLKVGKGKINSACDKTKAMTTEKCLEVDFPNELSPCLPDGVINIDVDDEMLEYGAEIVIHLKQKEKDFILPQDFLCQNSVSDTMRSVLVDWLIQVQHHLKFSQQSLYLTIAMLDNILDKRDIDPDKLQLVGVTSLWIASKAEEYYPAELPKLIHLTEDSYKPSHVIQMEKIILRILQFNVYFPEPMVFLLRFARAALRHNDSMFIETCQYLIDSFIIHAKFSATSPSRLAAGAVLSSLHLFSALAADDAATSLSCWTATLVHYSGYSKGEVVPVALAMLREVFTAATDEDYKYNGANTKYKSQSQHRRLVLQSHLAPNVIRKAGHNLGGSNF